MNKATAGQRIRQRRKLMKLSQKELAKACGVSESSISLWEADNTAPRGVNLHKLASALQCLPTWILHGDQDKSPGEPKPHDVMQQLTEDEQEILRLYRSLPESEQLAQLNSMKARVENFSRLFDELLEARKRTPL